MDNQQSCNHRWNKTECIKCGKKRPGSNAKIPKYQIEKSAKLMNEMLLSQIFRGWK